MEGKGNYLLGWRSDLLMNNNNNSDNMNKNRRNLRSRTPEANSSRSRNRVATQNKNETDGEFRPRSASGYYARPDTKMRLTYFGDEDVSLGGVVDRKLNRDALTRVQKTPQNSHYNLPTKEPNQRRINRTRKYSNESIKNHTSTDQEEEMEDLYKEPLDSYDKSRFDRNDYFRKKYSSSNNSDNKNNSKKVSYDPHDERYYVNKKSQKEVGNYSPGGFEIHHYQGSSNNSNRSSDNYAWGRREEEEEETYARTASPSKRQINKHRRKSRDNRSSPEVQYQDQRPRRIRSHSPSHSLIMMDNYHQQYQHQYTDHNRDRNRINHNGDFDEFGLWRSNNRNRRHSESSARGYQQDISIKNVDESKKQSWVSRKGKGILLNLFSKSTSAIFNSTNGNDDGRQFRNSPQVTRYPGQSSPQMVRRRKRRDKQAATSRREDSNQRPLYLSGDFNENYGRKRVRDSRSNNLWANAGRYRGSNKDDYGYITKPPARVEQRAYKSLMHLQDSGPQSWQSGRMQAYSVMRNDSSSSGDDNNSNSNNNNNNNNNNNMFNKGRRPEYDLWVKDSLEKLEGGDVSEDTGISSADSRYFPDKSYRRDRLRARRSSPQLSQLSKQQQLSTAAVDYEDRRSVRTVDSFMDEVHSKQSHFFNSLFPSRANRFGYPVYPERNLGIPPVSGPVSFAGFSPSRSELNISSSCSSNNNNYVSHGPPSILSHNSQYSVQAYSEGDLGRIRNRKTWKKKLVDFAKAF